VIFPHPIDTGIILARYCNAWPATGTAVEAEKPAPTASGAHVPTFDCTHLGPKGAAFFSGIVAAEIAASFPELADHLRSDQ
jgi:hypothetical protein